MMMANVAKEKPGCSHEQPGFCREDKNASAGLVHLLYSPKNEGYVKEEGADGDDGFVVRFHISVGCKSVLAQPMHDFQKSCQFLPTNQEQYFDAPPYWIGVALKKKSNYLKTR